MSSGAIFNILFFLLFFLNPQNTVAYTLGASLLFESDDLLAPAVAFQSDGNSNKIYSLSLIGRSASLGIKFNNWQKTFIRLNLECTPKFAGGSDRIYDSEFKRQLSQNYDDAQLKDEISVFTELNSWTFSTGLQSDYHRLQGLAETESDVFTDQWNHVQIGLLGNIEYLAAVTFDRYKNRFEGQKEKLRGDVFYLPNQWNKINLSVANGKFYRYFYVAQEVAFFNGKNLDRINRHVIGGSWDVPDTNRSYGTRAYQIRLQKGVLANARVDYLSAFMLDFDLSLEFGAVASETDRSVGGVFKIMKTYRGIFYELGFSRQQTLTDEKSFDQFILARLTMAIFS